MARETDRKALYPGSFDPPTNGHAWVIEKVADEYDTGYVAVGHNPSKPGRFPIIERQNMLRELSSDYPNIEVTSFIGMYQADFAETLGANVIVRGMRNADYDSENDITQVNRTINPNIETIFRIPPNELQQVSSSMVMGLVGFEGWEEQVKAMVPIKVFDRIEQAQKEKEKRNLQNRWNTLHARLQANGNKEEQFEDLYARYQEPHRAYHDTNHLQTCLNELELVREKIQQPDQVELALWFHDAVYASSTPQDPERPVKHDDEGESAELAKKIITEKMFIWKDIVDPVAQLILATKHDGTAEAMDQKYMVDIDLAILGRSSRLFDAYEAKIRQEYHWVSEDAFRAGRAAILETFLPPYRDTVYQTAFFQDRYERQARENLTRSITSLRASK